jgi:hypothetical protein
VIIDGSVTDAAHRIVLTADLDNRPRMERMHEGDTLFQMNRQTVQFLETILPKDDVCFANSLPPSETSILVLSSRLALPQ